MTFSLFQPQLLRIMKTLENISDYNAFIEGALNAFYTYKLSDEVSKEYLMNYAEWNQCKDSTKSADRAKAEKLREKMMDVEEKTTDMNITKIRQIVVNLNQDKLTLNKQIDEIDQQVKQKVSEQVGFGIMLSFQAKLEI